MSEYSESYHLLALDQQSGIDLLKKASLKGFVYPTANRWVTLLPAGLSFQPNEELIAANEGTLVHLIYAEDHGCAFSIYEGSSRVCHFECAWEEDFEVHKEELNVNVLLKLLDKNHNHYTSQTVSELFDQDEEEMFLEQNPIEKLADLLGLSNYEWNSYDYLIQEQEDQPNTVLDKGIMII